MSMEFSYLNAANLLAEWELPLFPHAGTQTWPDAGFDIMDPSRIMMLDEPEPNPPQTVSPSSGVSLPYPEQTALLPQTGHVSGRQDFVDSAIRHSIGPLELVSQAPLPTTAKRTRHPNKNPVLGNNPVGRKGLRRCRQCRAWRQKCVYERLELPCTKCFEKGFKCGIEEKVWGSSRQALERSNRRAQIGNGFGYKPNHDDMDIEEIPRGPPPDTEDINPSERACLRLFWEEMFGIDDPTPGALMAALCTHLFHHFGPNISSKAVRHAILSSCSDEDQYSSLCQISGLERSVLAMHYTQKAINEHAYVEILYAAFFMVAYSSVVPDRDLSAEDEASIALNHVNAYLFCLNMVSVDIEESFLLALFLNSIWRRLMERLVQIDLRNSLRLPNVFVQASQLTRSFAQLMPNSEIVAEWINKLDYTEVSSEVGVKLYLNCWYHLRLLIHGDVEEIDQIASSIRDTLLWYLSLTTVSTLRSQSNSNGDDDDLEDVNIDEMDVSLLEYALLVEPSLSLAPDIHIRDRVLKAAQRLHHRTVLYPNSTDLWQTFVTALLFKSILQGEVDWETSASMRLLFLKLLTADDNLQEAERVFLLEFFEVACQTGDILKLEINGRGLYDCMQLLGRDIYEEI